MSCASRSASRPASWRRRPARTTDLLERDLGRTWAGAESIELELRPFEIVTLRVSPAGGAEA
ncbi:glycosyl hydrolase-related protein [Symbioplanes lichenis]|uniref:glycosyl hydrolase-related protein n=1 Tax=Symbioplanes lichenis TaxID=1629072 RepID=UPI002739C1D9|nr:glycosyl hydrolase-related protein [Actinoplanes lichenis]